MMKAHLTLCFALLLVCIGAGAAFAQGTPDGMPPARESVCDAEMGAAYGLCNAYCEAMDCDSAAPNASATACTKVRTKFQNVTGRDVTCEGCPCSSIPEFNAVLSTINFCLAVPEAIIAGPGPIVNSFPPSDGPFDLAVPGVCGYGNVATSTTIFLPTSEHQSALCLQILQDAVANRGVTCSAP